LTGEGTKIPAVDRKEGCDGRESEKSGLKTRRVPWATAREMSSRLTKVEILDKILDCDW
jgi:hypothetical protein